LAARAQAREGGNTIIVFAGDPLDPDQPNRGPSARG
jgi:hypothetical protein